LFATTKQFLDDLGLSSLGDLPPLEAVQVRGFVQNRIRSNQSCLFTVSATGIDFSDNASSTFKIELLQNGYHLGIKNGHECDIGSMPSNAVINNTIVRVKTLCKRADAEGNPLPDEEFISLYLD
jgi:hypothetical protein